MTGSSFYPTNHQGPICDFCLAPSPRWAFDGPDPNADKVIEVEGEKFCKLDNGVWAACTRCSGLVTRGLVDRLVSAAVRGMLKGGHINITEVVSYTKYLEGFYPEVLKGLGPRRARNERERRSTGVIEFVQPQNPSQN